MSRVIACCLAVLGLLGYCAPLSVSAQDPGGATANVVPSREFVGATDGDVTVDIVARDVEDLGAFDFVLAYDNKVLEFKSLEKGEFLGSTGREVVCPEPTTEEGAVQFKCVSLRATPAAPNGDGVLATLTFTARAGGVATFDLNRVRFLHPDSTDIAVTGVNAQITVSSSTGWSRWQVVSLVGGALGVLALAGIGWRILRARGLMFGRASHRDGAV